MKIVCDKCRKEFNDIFETLVRCDYTEPGKGKPYEWHICVNCRKKLIGWFKS